MSFKNAMKCKKCPESNSEIGCPVWWEVILTDDSTGKQKVVKGCGFQILPEMLALTCKSAMHTTYAAYDMRNKVVKNMGKLIGAVKDKLQLPEELEIDDEELLITHKEV